MIQDQFPHLFAVSNDILETTNIGKQARFKNPTCPAQEELYTIVAVQKDHLGNIMYRGVSENDVYNFGYPMPFVEIKIDY